MVILGIDPGTQRIGYGLVEKEKNSLRFLAAGILEIKTKNSQQVLLEMKNRLTELIKEWQPQIMAIEKLYFSKNRKTAMAVAEARGALISAALENNLEIKEYSPNEVKLNIAGYGSADKKSVFKMVKLILRQPDLKIIDDASDALALAILGSGKNI